MSVVGVVVDRPVTVFTVDGLTAQDTQIAERTTSEAAKDVAASSLGPYDGTAYPGPSWTYPPTCILQ